ncbi:nickel pincer cofactor biosynthesis protein LarB [Lichenihabitans sp. Uapishka_5]|uniref:nickel pincer cofactor biosynthesis protein LarB n=1 Tax=Lichenihabitans sp. Uapishka_5 TaxID=3037302 RepID=UPI0029E7E0D8|nr:nickel pincer cofactor biosynthesis protein LarB [Lichenihabitans sp. Uapishka_5]MDX7953211.1 nickel pincer cofactor biosynthesis protein LarB [Lichenihabitans sp. Uapishka_5]
MAEFTFDYERRSRIGLDEAVFCAGKSTAQIAAIVAGVRDGVTGLLLTRLDPEKFEALPVEQRAGLDYDPVSRTAILGAARPIEPGPAVAIVLAGTSDVPMAREAARTLHFNGQAQTTFTDIGVAGLWRLLDRLEEIRLAPVVIVVAGMDAALISVVGGLVSGAVIGLPTSVGYGVAAGGQTALHSGLASCAPGVPIVNIDNGYGAACAALRIMNTLRRHASAVSDHQPGQPGR